MRGAVATPLPTQVTDHKGEPEWETSTASDLCKACGWPVTNRGGAWTHDAKNPVQWSPR